MPYGLKKKRLESEEFQQYLKFFREWTPLSDVFCLKHFAVAISAFCGGSAAYINSKFRKAVKLRANAFVSSYFTIMVVPSLICTTCHFVFVLRPTLMREGGCPLCLQTRSGAIFATCGVVLPSLLAPFSTFMHAIRYHTYPIPVLVKEPKANFKLVLKISKPILPQITILAIFMFSAGMLLARCEEHNYQTVMTKLSTMEALLKERNELEE